jgi:REP element-mobilizing transposase RayT
MNDNRQIRNRRSIRLKGYDYSQAGAYFITICVQNREHIFGKIEKGIIILNDYGKIVENQWQWLFKQYDYLKMDQYCVMPNHFHGIIWINPAVVVGNGRDRSLRDNNDRSLRKIKPIPELIGAFKTTSSKMIHLSGNHNFKWQKSYHDRIIRNDDELIRIKAYIINNAQNWALDDYYD